MLVKYLPNPVGLTQTLQSPSGVVGLYMVTLATAASSKAKQNAPYKTGELRGSIGYRISGPPLSVEVYADAPHALAVHEGTAPHVITPNTARILAFPVKGGGKVFTSRVNHPGTKANPFLLDAVESVVTL